MSTAFCPDCRIRAFVTAVLFYHLLLLWQGFIYLKDVENLDSSASICLGTKAGAMFASKERD